MVDMRLHNDCDGGFCVACTEDELRAKGKCCATCYWWLEDSHNGKKEGICRRYRPAAINYTLPSYCCNEHSFDSPYKHETAE